MKTYNYKSLIRSASRRIWMWSPMRRQAVKAARVAPNTIECRKCGLKVKENAKPKLFAVDHKIPASEPSAMIHSFDDFFKRLFCNPDGLQILCVGCHDAKTRKENEARKRNRELDKLRRKKRVTRVRN